MGGMQNEFGRVMGDVLNTPEFGEVRYRLQLEAENEWLAAERDALLEACKLFVEWNRSCALNDTESLAVAVEAAEAAIAEAEKSE
mgnify:CR=1 FL=1